jgi:hypothetical protein
MTGFLIGLFQFFFGLFLLFVAMAGGVIGERVLGHNGWLFGASAAILLCAVLFAPLLLLMRIDRNIATLRSRFCPQRAARTELDFAKDEVRTLEQDVDRIITGRSKQQER